MLDVRRLRLLSELHERGTVTAVAEALSYTPSAVSQQLATLEREAGVALLERDGRRLRLTDAGRLLVEHAEAVIARLELAESELAAAAGEGVAGRVRVPAAAAGADRDGGRGGARPAAPRRGRPGRRGGVRLRAAPARPVARVARALPRPARARAAGGAHAGGGRSRYRPARRARRRRLGDPALRDGVRRLDGARVPRAGRVRARPPPPLERS